VGDSNPANNSATDTDTLTPQADLAITKTDGVTAATAGGSVTYTITASNAGPSNATGATVADTFPASLTCTWTCVGTGGGTCTAAGSGNLNDAVNLPSGGSVTYTASCTVSASATGTLSNTATVTAPAGVTDPAPGNNSATDSDTLAAQADLSITKTDGVTTATPGGSVTYTITASNSGPSNATGATVADTFPASLTCTWTCAGAGGGTCTAAGSGNLNDTVNLPSGGSVTYTASCTLSAAATGTLSNTATVTAPAGVTDPAPGNNSATDTDTVGAQQADLQVTKVDTPDPVVPGGNITYTITVTNAGPSSAANVVLSDTLQPGTPLVSLTSPAGWSCPAFPPGFSGTISCSNPSFGVGSAVFTLTVSTSPGLTTGTVISNTASVTSSTADSNPGNDSATATTTVAPNPGAVTLTKTAFPFPSVVAGTGLLYSITATNATGGNLGAATVTDVLPAGTTFHSSNGVPAGWNCVTPPVGSPGTVTCSTPTFAPGDANIGFFVIVDASVPAGTVLTNTAHLIVTGNPVITRDATTTTTVFTPGVIVYGTKTVSGGAHTPGSALTYTIVLHNNGDTAQPDNLGAELTDVLPAGLTLVSATATSGVATVDVPTRTVTWNGGIPAGGSVTITINATIDANVAPGTTLSNQGTIAIDSDASGSNESTRPTDDPAAGGASDPTTFQVQGGSVPPPIPTLDEAGLMLLALLLAMGGAVMLRRRRA
jgi:uncharacterized repeat protein (TIGR01451 family)